MTKTEKAILDYLEENMNVKTREFAVALEKNSPDANWLLGHGAEAIYCLNAVKDIIKKAEDDRLENDIEFWDVMESADEEI